MLQGLAQKCLEHPLIWPETVEFRLYQKSIADIALEKNTLVILPTALGKTVISVMAAADILYNYRDFKILVMAPTRPLIMQHKGSFLAMMLVSLPLRKLVKSSFNGSVRCEYADISYFIWIHSVPFHQLKGEKAWVPLIHVIFPKVKIQRIKYPYTTDSKNNFLF